MRIRQLLLLLSSLFFSSHLFAHGLVESPASRNWFCGAVTKPDQIGNGTAQYPICGSAFSFAANPQAGYSFMSVLTHAEGRSVVTPLPTNVCSFGSETWNGAVTPWDAPINWPTNPMSAGQKTFTWNISWGPHFDDTKEFKYWITKSSFQFSASRALTWNDFETTPFCSLGYDDKNPNGNPNVTPEKAASKFHTKCNVPNRTGRHVIYAEWGRNQFTFERFHGCIDVAFDGTNPNPVVAQITTTPATTTVTGATSIQLSASGSQGTGLTYSWSVDSPNASLYTLSSTTAVNPTLTVRNPQAETSFTVRLTVASAGATDSTSVQFTHLPSVASSWQDFGALTTTSRTLAVGDKVSVRMVTTAGADVFFPSTPITITSSTTGAAAWPYALAQAINNANGDIRVGVLSNNIVTAAQNATSNRIYARTPNNYTSAFLTVVPATTGGANCTYVISNQWNNGFTAVIRIKNNRTTAINGWSVNWAYSDASRITNSWNITLSGSNPYTAVNLGWNANIQPGQTVEFGFQGTKPNGAAAQVPSVTGAACN
jgi:chitin-binding protein